VHIVLVTPLMLAGALKAELPEPEPGCASQMEIIADSTTRLDEVAEVVTDTGTLAIKFEQLPEAVQ